MGDLSYNVVVNLEARGNLQGAVAGLNSPVNQLTSSFAGLGSSVTSALGGVVGGFQRAVEGAAGFLATVGKVGAVAALGGLAASVTELNGKLEETQISLATVFNANGITNGMSQGMQLSATMMERMRKDAADLPGEFKDLVNIFQMSAMPGLNAGMNVAQLEKLSSSTMAAATAAGVPMQMAAREMAMLLSGRAGAHNVLGMKVFGLQGDDAKAFNHMAGGDRVKVLTERLAAFAPAIETYKNSFIGLSSTFIDSMKKFASVATMPLFNKVKATLGEINDYIDKNKGSLESFFSGLGAEIGIMFRYVKDAIIEWWPVARVFVGNLHQELLSIWQRMHGPIERMGEKLKQVLTDPQLFTKIERVLELYAATKLAGPAIPMAGEAAGALAGAAGLSGGAAAALAAPLALAVGGAIDNLTNSSSPYHDSATRDVTNLGQVAARSGEDLLKLRRAVDQFGSMWLSSVTAGVETFSYLWELTRYGCEKMADFTESLGKAADNVVDQATDWVKRLFGILNKENFESPDREPVDISAASIRKMDEVYNPKDPTQISKTGAGGGGGGTHIQKVEIVVTSNQDPSRIARLTMEELKHLARNPRSSRGVNVMSRSRP